MLRLTISVIFLSINDLKQRLNPCSRERSVIKLDIINEVVGKTGITKTKAELAVETVFESMKKALAAGNRIELRGFGVFNVRPRKTALAAIPARGRSFHSARKRRAFQAGQRTAVDRLRSACLSPIAMGAGFAPGMHFRCIPPRRSSIKEVIPRGQKIFHVGA